MDKNYGGVIWTDHALRRLSERKIKQGDAWFTFRRPQQSRYAKSLGAWIYYRTYGNERIEVVAKRNEKKEWIIISVWSKKVNLQNLSKNFPQENFFSRILRFVLGLD